MNTIKCPNCGNDNKNTNIRCENCGTELNSIDDFYTTSNKNYPIITLDSKQSYCFFKILLMFFTIPSILFALGFIGVGTYCMIFDNYQSNSDSIKLIIVGIIMLFVNIIIIIFVNKKIKKLIKKFQDNNN